MTFGKSWSAETMVWVTDWGHAVHNSPSCPGIAAFGSKDQSTRVRLDNRLCAVRRACKKCFAEFYGVDSLRALDRLIEKLHGEVDFDQQARTLIATTARLRVGDATARPSSSKGPGSRAKPTPSTHAIVSSGRSSPPKVSRQSKAEAKRERDLAAASTLGNQSKAEAKRERDLAAASRLGITVPELRARRRNEQDLKRARKVAQQGE